MVRSYASPTSGETKNPPQFPVDGWIGSPELGEEGCKSCQVMGELKADFARFRTRLKKTASELRVEALRDIGWKTLKGRGGRARWLRDAPRDALLAAAGYGSPFARASGRPVARIPGHMLMMLLVVTHNWLEHLRRDYPPARRRAHLDGAPEWIWGAYLNAKAALDACNTLADLDDPVLKRWRPAKARLARALVAQHLEIDEHTVQRIERDYWAAPRGKS
jgi:hypothetical protein